MANPPSNNLGHILSKLAASAVRSQEIFDSIYEQNLQIYKQLVDELAVSGLPPGFPSGVGVPSMLRLSELSASVEIDLTVERSREIALTAGFNGRILNSFYQSRFEERQGSACRIEISVATVPAEQLS